MDSHPFIKERKEENMNQVSEVITTLLHYNVSIRDTLEYCLKKETYDPKLFNDKKRAVLIEVDQHTPLKDIIDHSGENGQKLEKLIRDFHEEVYGDSSTILHLADDGLRVDHNQHLPIYRGVLPIHENINSMIAGIVRDAQGKDLDVTEAVKVWNAEDAMFRGVAYLTLTNDLIALFNDYNKARQEAKGAESPSSKFISNDIQTIVSNINFVRSSAKEHDLVYKNMEDKIAALMEMMTGRRDLPTGKRFPEVMRETIETIQLYVRDAEASFRAVYVPLVNELLAQVKKDREAKEAAEKNPQA